MESPGAEPDMKQAAVDEYKRKLLQHKEVDSKVRSLRDEVKTAKAEYDKTEDDLKALQSVGQIIGEVLRQLDEERCECDRRRCDGALNGRACLPCRLGHPLIRHDVRPPTPPSASAPAPRSHSQVEQRAALRGGLPQPGGRHQAHAQHAGRPRRHHPHHHAHPAARGACPPPEHAPLAPPPPSMHPASGTP